MNLALTETDHALLDGAGGPVRAKVMQTVVCYGQALGARALLDITGPGHLVIAYALPGIAPDLQMLEELAAAGMRARHPFTLDPRPPLDFDRWSLDAGQRAGLQAMYHEQRRYEALLLQLGLRDERAYTCRPYLPEVGNVPRVGDVLAWSESACAIFANSVLGARTNRNGAIIDLLCNLVGRVPASGLLLDEGRRADWRIDLKTRSLPPPQLLGAVIGRTVLAGVPWIDGLTEPMSELSEWARRDYLQELGAACATAGAVGLFHVAGMTPEALGQGRCLLRADARERVVVDADIEALQASFPLRWSDPQALPGKCFLGCPHLSAEQIGWWAQQLQSALQRRGRARIRVPTTISAAPQTLDLLRTQGTALSELEAAGVQFSPGCPMQLFDNQLSAHDAIITNSNKLRSYSTARYLPERLLVEVICDGHWPDEAAQP